MSKFYCENCGTNRASVSALTSSRCPKHPDGLNKGYHILYQGTEKSQYTCKYCGTKKISISALSVSLCPRHPKGLNKGHHCPAL